MITAGQLKPYMRMVLVGETYNIGGNNEIKNIDIVNTICSILDEINH